MDNFKPCQEISDCLGDLFTCSPVGEFIRIKTPYVYPDGDVIDLFYKDKAGIKTLTDLGETNRWLRMQSTSKNRSLKQKKLIQDICMTHRVEFHRGMLILRLAQGDDKRSFSEALIDLSEASIRFADLWFMQTNKNPTSILDDVEFFLQTQEIAYERNRQVEGVSGNFWKPHFYTRTSEISAYTFVLSTRNVSNSSGMIHRTVSAWYDLRNLKAINEKTVKFVSLFNDTNDIWTEEDFNMLRELSEITFWSHKPGYAKALLKQPVKTR